MLLTLHPPPSRHTLCFHFNRIEPICRAYFPPFHNAQNVWTKTPQNLPQFEVHINNATKSHAPTWPNSTPYCWWLKSCTSWYGESTIIYRVLNIPGGAGFLPSTVSTKRSVQGCHRSLSKLFALHPLQIQQMFFVKASGCPSFFLGCKNVRSHSKGFRFKQIPPNPYDQWVWHIYFYLHLPQRNQSSM